MVRRAERGVGLAIRKRRGLEDEALTLQLVSEPPRTGHRRRLLPHWLLKV